MDPNIEITEEGLTEKTTGQTILSLVAFTAIVDAVKYEIISDIKRNGEIAHLLRN